ncbi:hypothetical protein DICVIV_14449, partial [Dictyocaulus viviparus]
MNLGTCSVIVFFPEQSLLLLPQTLLRHHSHRFCEHRVTSGAQNLKTCIKSVSDSFLLDYTFAFSLLLATLVQSGVLWYSPLSWVVTVYIIIIYQQSSFKWNKLFGLYLSRKFRTLFDEMNILETYQPRAWTMGYLFE